MIEVRGNCRNAWINYYLNIIWIERHTIDYMQKPICFLKSAFESNLFGLRHVDVDICQNWSISIYNSSVNRSPSIHSQWFRSIRPILHICVIYAFTFVRVHTGTTCRMTTFSFIRRQFHFLRFCFMEVYWFATKVIWKKTPKNGFFFFFRMIGSPDAHYECKCCWNDWSVLFFVC